MTAHLEYNPHTNMVVPAHVAVHQPEAWVPCLYSNQSVSSIRNSHSVLTRRGIVVSRNHARYISVNNHLASDVIPGTIPPKQVVRAGP